MSKSKTVKRNTTSPSSDVDTFGTVFFYCILIIASPILSFFATKHFIFDSEYMSLSSIQSNIYAAVSAVLVLHIALGLYLYKAYSEQSPTNVKTSEKKID